MSFERFHLQLASNFTTSTRRDIRDEANVLSSCVLFLVHTRDSACFKFCQSHSLASSSAVKKQDVIMHSCVCVCVCVCVCGGGGGGGGGGGVLSVCVFCVHADMHTTGRPNQIWSHYHVHPSARPMTTTWRSAGKEWGRGLWIQWASPCSTRGWHTKLCWTTEHPPCILDS